MALQAALALGGVGYSGHREFLPPGLIPEPGVLLEKSPGDVALVPRGRVLIPGSLSNPRGFSGERLEGQWEAGGCGQPSEPWDSAGASMACPWSIWNVGL